MQQSPPPSTRPDGLPDWFSDSQPAAQPQATVATKPPRRPLGRKTKALIVIVLAVILVVAGVNAYRIITVPACLSSNDYKQLTGNDYGDQLQPQSDFYTALVGFGLNSTDYSTDDSGEALVKKLAKFYTDRPHTSIRFSLQSTFLDGIDRSIMRQRVEKIQSDLIKLGVPTEDVVTPQPTFVTPEEDDALVDDPQAVAVSIVSLEGCR